MKKIKELADLFLGKTAKQKFKRIMIILIWFSISAMLFYNVSCTDKHGLEWKPAGKVNIDVKKGRE